MSEAGSELTNMLRDVLGLMLRKTGKQRCKNPGVPSDDRGNWG